MALFLGFLCLVAFIGVVLLFAIKIIDERPRLEPETYDKVNTTPQKLSKFEFERAKKGQSVSFGVCTCKIQ